MDRETGLGVEMKRGVGEQKGGTEDISPEFRVWCRVQISPPAFDEEVDSYVMGAFSF